MTNPFTQQRAQSDVQTAVQELEKKHPGARVAIVLVRPADGKAKDTASLVTGLSDGVHPSWLLAILATLWNAEMQHLHGALAQATAKQGMPTLRTEPLR